MSGGYFGAVGGGLTSGWGERCRWVRAVRVQQHLPQRTQRARRWKFQELLPISTREFFAVPISLTVNTPRRGNLEPGFFVAFCERVWVR